MDNPQHEYSHQIQPTISPDSSYINSLHSDLRFNADTTFHDICLDEGAPHSVTGVNQWMAYLRAYHLPTAFHNIQRPKLSITFGGKGRNRVQVMAIGRVAIRVPLPAKCYFDFQALLIKNDVPMLLGLH